MTLIDWLPHLPPGTDPHQPVAPTTSLVEPWLRQWGANRPVLHDDAAGWLRGDEMEERSHRVAGALAAAGAAPGDRIVVSTAPTAGAVVAYVGALRAGLVVVPVNTAYREAEVAHIVRDARPRAAIVDDADRARWVREAAGADGIVIHTPDLTTTAPDNRGSVPALGPGDPGLLIYTSGTTGQPKGALLTHGNLLAGVEALRLAWRWSPDDRLAHALPLFHLHGLGAGINGTFHAGASLVLRPHFDAGDILRTAADHGATLFFGVPTMYGRIAEHPDVARLVEFRLAVSGSAPLSPDLFRAVQLATGHAILERYGMTETMLTVSNPHDGERRPGTVGFPLPGVELRLAPDGEVQVRGPSVFAGYWERAEATAETFTPDGWLRSGDIGEMDGAGYLKIVGRSRDLIISGGYNVYPREVEEALEQHPAIAEAAVRGVPSTRWGEEVSAWVVATDAVTEDAVLAFARARLAPYKCPKSVRFVDALPRNALGKILKQELD